jgi:hypothetical protein
MQETYLLDSGGTIAAMFAAAIFGGSILLTIIIISLAILIEAFILYRLKWGSKLYSFISSFTVNSLSATVGALLFLFLPSIYISIVQDRGFLGMLLFLMINLGITLLIETPIIVLLNLAKLYLGIEASLKMNIASYLAYIGIFSILFLVFLG